jgi:hypothetical protein
MLSNISVGYDNPDQFVASMLFPVVRVGRQSDKYYVYNRDTWGRVFDDLRTPGSEANELPPMTLSRDSYFIEEHALEDVVTDEEVDEADAPLTPMQDSTERLTNTILLNREVTMTTLATTAANYAAGFTTTLVGTAQWSDYSGTSDPIADVKVGRNKIHDNLFRDPNVAIMGYQVAQKLEDHPKFLARIQYAAIGITTDALIAELMGISRFVRAGAGRLTNNYGTSAESFGYLWGKDMVLAFVPDNPGRRQPSYGYEFVRPYADAGQAGDMPTERWREQKRKSDVIRTSRRYDIKFISVDNSGKVNSAGYLIKNAVA